MINKSKLIKAASKLGLKIEFDSPYTGFHFTESGKTIPFSKLDLKDLKDWDSNFDKDDVNN